MGWTSVLSVRGLPPSPLIRVDGGVNVVHLETDMIDAQPQRLAVLSGLELQNGNVEMTVGEIDSVLP